MLGRDVNLMQLCELFSELCGRLLMFQHWPQSASNNTHLWHVKENRDWHWKNSNFPYFTSSKLDDISVKLFCCYISPPHFSTWSCCPHQEAHGASMLHSQASQLWCWRFLPKDWAKMFPNSRLDEKSRPLCHMKAPSAYGQLRICSVTLPKLISPSTFNFHSLQRMMMLSWGYSATFAVWNQSSRYGI